MDAEQCEALPVALSCCRADGPYYHQNLEGMTQTTAIISGGMNALCLPALFENVGH